MIQRVIHTLIVCALVSVAEVVTSMDLTRGIVLVLLTAYLFDWRK